MSAKKLTARTAEVGGMPIARLLPNRDKQPIGAWCFLDHIGPAEIEAGEPGMQVGRHPHTNLQTFTWMLHGEIRHRDSLGYDQIIRKGQVNLMTEQVLRRASATLSKVWWMKTIAFMQCSFGLRCRWINRFSQVFITILTCRLDNRKAFVMP
ncbi:MULTISPECIES: pirin family protein [Moraxella]|nr:pirin family protein [Moraxella catarrhalis]STY82319.1 Pirin [Moraxella catarrhalis]